jgi:hypothetical protein
MQTKEFTPETKRRERKGEVDRREAKTKLGRKEKRRAFSPSTQLPLF